MPQDGPSDRLLLLLLPLLRLLLLLLLIHTLSNAFQSPHIAKTEYNIQLDPLPRRRIMLAPTPLILLRNLTNERIRRVRVGEEGREGEDDFVQG